ncbi:MAG: phosphoribosylformylglycinamidine synthase subunit PurQ [Sphingobacteriia bacterium]|nr:phosphoribosylformylglycinamidine synthase subunit PurQ [Sphingobacteriia bacterium]
MKFGVVVFPGSNCDEDMVYVLEHKLKLSVVKLWHKETHLNDCTHVIIPGGFSYGDYLRSGAIARFSPIMNAVISHANAGGFVFGVCNGFQILCESGLLPGALLHNNNLQFTCKNTFIKAENLNSVISSDIKKNQVLKIPIAHGEGKYYIDAEGLALLKQHHQIIFKYCSENGTLDAAHNPNGSVEHIAGICNKTKNVFGMMPHPERAADSDLGNTDGLYLFNSILKAQKV